MDKYIEQKKAVEAIKDFAKGTIESGKNSLDAVDDILALIKIIEAIPCEEVQNFNKQQLELIQNALRYYSAYAKENEIIEQIEDICGIMNYIDLEEKQMQNYLMINGKQINLSEEQVKEIKQSFGIGNVQLSSLKPGETFKIGEYEFFVLEQQDGNTVILLKDLLHTSKEFGSNNNYDGSDVDELCNEFGDIIENLVGAENIVEHIVDLTADDGLKCYGSVSRKMSLLTANQYRKYVYIIDEHKLDSWWWLATAFSTAKHNDESWVKCVSPFGFIGNYDFHYYYGVRPFCILKSNIFVSK